MNQQKHTIGIVTIDNYTNYGNRLQNFALTRLLESEGFEVVNGIQVYTKQDYVSNSSSAIKKLVKQLIPFFLIKKTITPRPIKNVGLLKERKERFVAFVHKYTNPIGVIVVPTHKRAMKILHRRGIEFCLTGSDQVWNPYYEGRNYEFLNFMPSNKRLSFAASLGVDEIPKDKKEKYKRYFSEMKYLSVREQRAVEIIKELTGRDADLTPDPTLLLEREKWQDVVKKPDIQLDSDYICTYFLGEVPEAVEHFAREKGLKIYPLNDKEAPELFVIDPGEFLYMIQNAAYVLTDSFHAVAFSIKFNKEFYVFDRKENGVAGMFSRIETIAKLFGLENRIQNREKIVEQLPISNWMEIENKLAAEKKKSMKKLLEVMGY